MEPLRRKRRMSDSDLLLKSADNTVKVPYQEWLKFQRMELTAVAGEKRRELLQKELEKRSSLHTENKEFDIWERFAEHNKNLNIDTQRAESEDSGYAVRASLEDPSELQTEERGRKSGITLLLLCCIVVRCVMLKYNFV